MSEWHKDDEVLPYTVSLENIDEIVGVISQMPGFETIKTIARLKRWAPVLAHVDGWADSKSIDAGWKFALCEGQVVRINRTRNEIEVHRPMPLYWKNGEHVNDA